MKPAILIIIAMLSLSANAQLEVMSTQIDRAAAVDTARYLITYDLNYSVHPHANRRFKDVRNVLVGRHAVKDFSDIIFHFDSLATEDYRNGKDTFSNPPGNPWPVEILLHTHEKRIDMKRRLPLMNSGTLCWSDTIPALKWEFVADTTKNILGYECQLAATNFRGRDYSAWYTTELPLPYGPYKFGGLPGLIVQMQDSEKQFVWNMSGFERSAEPIYVYEYVNEKICSASDADKTIIRMFQAPLAFQLAAIGGGRGRIMIVGKDGKTRDATEVEDTPIPYLPLEIR